jgi:membrane-associated phospholipid phosphatase
MAIEVIANKARKIAETLNATDRLLIAFWVLLSLASLLLHSRFPNWQLSILANSVACLTACLIAFIAKSSNSKVLHGIHHWAAYPLVVFTYKQIYYLIPPIHQGKDYDSLLIAMDQALFRVHPTQWMEGFSNPYLTELFQIFYSLFFVFFLVVGIELYRKHGFAFFRFTAVYGFLISYIGYLFLPAVGPRFTLHDFSRIGSDLPGLFVTSALRWCVNICESIPAGASNSVALACAQRDAMPSGHAMMMVIMMVFVCKEKLKCRNFILVSGVLLIIATVYLRYHYIVDLVAGILLAIFCISTADGLRKWIKSVLCNSNSQV